MSEEKTPEPSKARSKRGSSRKNRWEAEASELRVRRIISNLGFWAGTFIIATLLGIVISQQVRMNNVIETVQHYEEELNTDIELSTGVGLALAANRLPEYMLDELAEIEADQVPEEPAPPLLRGEPLPPVLLGRRRRLRRCRDLPRRENGCERNRHYCDGRDLSQQFHRIYPQLHVRCPQLGTSLGLSVDKDRDHTPHARHLRCSIDYQFRRVQRERIE